MGKVNYRETDLWTEANKLLVQVYASTRTWPSEANDVAKDLQQVARGIVRAVPGAFRKGGITGNIHLRMSGAHFGELEALCGVGVSLGYMDSNQADKIIELAMPVRTQFRELSEASKAHARELMEKRSNIFGGGLHDDDEDDF